MNKVTFENKEKSLETLKLLKTCNIGIIGKMGSGKTTAQKIIVKSGRETYNMADPLKLIGEALQFEKSELYGTQEQKLKPNEFWGVSARKFLQICGTELFRKHLKTYIPEMYSVWSQLFEKKCKENPEKKYIVGDVRFLDEAESVKKTGGILIKIIRSLKSDGKRAKHASETEQDKITPDIYISNTGSLKEFEQTLEMMFQSS